MSNFRRESKRRIHSFILSRLNIKHWPVTLWWRIVLDFEWNEVKKKNGHIRNRYHILEGKNGSYDTM